MLHVYKEMLDDLELNIASVHGCIINLFKKSEHQFENLSSYVALVNHNSEIMLLTTATVSAYNFLVSIQMTLATI